MKKIIILQFILNFGICFSQTKLIEISFTVKEIAPSRIELSIENNTSQSKTLLMDLSYIRLYGNNNFDMNETFLSNVLVFQNAEKYDIPYSLWTSTEYDECLGYGNDRLETMQNYIKKNIVIIKSGEKKKVIYNLSNQSNIISLNEKKYSIKYFNIYIVYKGKNILEYITKSKCLSELINIENVYLENIESNHIIMKLKGIRRKK